MNSAILLILLTWQLCLQVPLITARFSNQQEKCPFERTVNLTNYQEYENGSYVYQGILIPPEKQHVYDYDVKFLGVKKTVPQHLRGCVCDQRPCIKLCCQQDEFFDYANTHKCKKLTVDMKVNWELPLQLKNKEMKVKNMLNHFTTQMGLPCVNPEPLYKDIDEWILSEDGFLNIISDAAWLSTIDYCYSPLWNENNNNYELTPFSCPIKSDKNWTLLFNTYGMVVSILFLIPTILVYLLVKELRESLRNKILICYLLSMTIGYLIISFINISGLRFSFIECSFLGYTCYFFFMAAFLWLSAMCFDMRNGTNGPDVLLSSPKSRNKFFIYSLYAWLIAALATVVIIYIQQLANVDEELKPGVGVEMCWLNTDRWSALYYFYGPNLCILLFNFVIFLRLSIKIYRQKEVNPSRSVAILRLYLIMGIPWIFDILSYCLRNYKAWNFLFFVSDFLNAIQGILIFSLFVLRPNVLKLLKNKFFGSEFVKPV